MNSTYDHPRRHAISVEEFLRMAESHVFAPDARLELMQGELVEMAPISSAHAAVVDTLDTLLREVAPRAMVRVQSPLVLGERSAPQPDVMVLRPRADRYYNSHPVAADALLVVEVADTTLEYDLEVKRPLYARVGVAELWVVDIARRELHVFREPKLEYSEELRLLDVPDAEIYYQPCLKLQASHRAVLMRLIEEVSWRSEEIVVWGKRHKQPRLIAWFGDEGATYTYSGVNLRPAPWTPLIADIHDRVESATHVSFNSVLLNYYRDHRDSMGYHSDDEPELGRNPAIASVSLGEIRTFVLKHKMRKDVKPTRLDLESGSLLLMKGPTQQNWKHGIDKLDRPCGPRVNLTFRRILPSATPAQ